MRRLITRLLKKRRGVETQARLRNLRDMVADWTDAALVRVRGRVRAKVRVRIRVKGGVRLSVRVRGEGEDAEWL